MKMIDVHYVIDSLLDVVIALVVCCLTYVVMLVLHSFISFDMETSSMVLMVSVLISLLGITLFRVNKYRKYLKMEKDLCRVWSVTPDEDYLFLYEIYPYSWRTGKRMSRIDYEKYLLKYFKPNSYLDGLRTKIIMTNIRYETKT
jgi:hypothetical protein